LTIVWNFNNIHYFFTFEQASFKSDVELLICFLSESDRRYLSYKVVKKHLKIDKK